MTGDEPVLEVVTTTDPHAPTVAAAEALELQASAVAITDGDSYARAAELLLGIKDLRAKIAETFDPHIKRAYEAHRALCASKREAEGSAIRAERLVKDRLVAWDLEQERIATAEAERLNRQALEAGTEATLADALEAAASGDVARAEQILDLPRPVATPAVPSRTPEVAGIAYRQTWAAEVYDFPALVAAAVGNPMWLALLDWNQKALDTLARRLKSRMAIPGVRAVSSKDVSARRGR